MRRHFHNADNRLLPGARHIHQLLYAGHVVDDQIIADHNHKGLVPHGIFRTEHGMAKAKLLFLPHGHDVHHFGNLTHLAQQFHLACALQHAFQLKIVVEMIFNHALFPVGDEHHIRHAGMHGLFHNILDYRFVIDGQHFLGDILACRQRTGTPTGHGNNNLTNIHIPSFRRKPFPAFSTKIV